MGLYATGCTDAENRVSHGNGGVCEMFATSGTKVAAVWVNAKPIAVQMWIAAIGTGYVLVSGELLPGEILWVIGPGR